MKLNTIILFILLISITATGCKKFVEVDLPITQLNTVAAFANDSKANSSMRGIYASLVGGLAPGPLFSANLGISSDELEKTSISGDQQFYFENNVGPDNATNNTIWTKLYSTIYQANNAWMNLEKSTGLTPLARDRMMGEARFLRAWMYFCLVNLYDSVPLITTPDYTVNALMSRTAPDKIYDLILEDLAYAQEKADDVYTVIGARGRANKWTASALLARVHLYMQHWAEAEQQATTVIGSGYYRMDPLDSTFQASAREPIMVLANAGINLYTSEANYITSANPNPTYRFTTYTNAAFETGDQRITKWTKVGANGLRTSYKYKTFDNKQTGAKKEGIPVFRLAEQYLIRAEARAMQNNLTGAMADLDSVRRRASVPLISVTRPNITKDELLQAIMKERITELFAEQGQRWFDIKRTGQADAIYSVRKAKWRKEAILFPIPLKEIQTNPNLGQNPGY